MRKPRQVTQNKIYFDLFDDSRSEFTNKCTAYVPTELIQELHRGHTYRVIFNDNPLNPTVVAILRELIL